MPSHTRFGMNFSCSEAVFSIRVTIPKVNRMNKQSIMKNTILRTKATLDEIPKLCQLIKEGSTADCTLNHFPCSFLALVFSDRQHQKNFSHTLIYHGTSNSLKHLSLPSKDLKVTNAQIACASSLSIFFRVS